MDSCVDNEIVELVDPALIVMVMLVVMCDDEIPVVFEKHLNNVNQPSWPQ